MKKYNIYVNEDVKKVNDILLKLFSMGYVFSTKRIRNIKDMKLEGYSFNKWVWIIIGSNKDCKMVLDRKNIYDNRPDGETIMITFEEFLKLPNE